MGLWFGLWRGLYGRLLRREDHLGEALLGRVLPTCLHTLEGFLLADLNRVLDEVANHGLDVASDVPDLGELRGLDLDERCMRQFRKPSRDFGLTDTGRPDHDDVARRDLFAEVAHHLLAAPTIAERDRHRPLGLVLPDDVAIELADRFARGEVSVLHSPISSTTIS
jgi:hypothetical protein